MNYDDLIILNSQPLNKKYIQGLDKQQRLDLIDPIFDILRKNGFIYMDDKASIDNEWSKLLKFAPDLNANDLFNNSSLATEICKFFCHKFYLATEKNKSTLIDNFNNDVLLKKMIQNRLGLDWLESDAGGPGVNEAFNLSFKMIAVQAQRSMRLVNATSMFKPSIAKYMCMKYSNEGDHTYDISCGWGGRLLGAMSSKRKYTGVDPWTTDELSEMVKYFKFDAKLINDGSENVRLDKDSIDFCYSSPPYFNQEVYSVDNKQAYNNGEDYFYNNYWKNTLDNVKYMLKPGKFFGLNVTNFPKMVEMADEVFGKPIEIVKLRTVRSHLTKNKGIEKFEPIFMYKK